MEISAKIIPGSDIREGVAVTAAAGVDLAAAATKENGIGTDGTRRAVDALWSSEQVI